MWAASLVLLIGLVFARTGHAQDAQQTALARTLFEEGVSLADRGDWVGAADRFERAHSLKPTSGIAYNWASALRETGKLVQAQELLLQVTRDPRADPDLKRQAEQALSALSPRIARLKVRVVDARERDIQVEVDGAGWPRAAWDVWSPIDPGAHTAVLKRGEDALRRAELTLGEGEHRELELSERATAADAPSGSEPANDHGERPKPLYKRWLLWTAVGAVVAGGVITGIVIAKHREPESASPVTGNAAPGVLTW